MSALSERLRIRRKEQHMTQEELAEIIGYKKQTVSGYERDENEPDYQTLCRIADALSCTADYLLGREEAPTHTVASVVEQTGLNEKTVSVLMYAKEAKDNPFDVKGKAILPFITAVLSSEELGRLALSFADWTEEAKNEVASQLDLPDLSQYMSYDKKTKQAFPKEKYTIRGENGEIIGYTKEFMEIGTKLDDHKRMDYMEAGARHSAVRGYERFISEQYKKIISDAKNEKGE